MHSPEVEAARKIRSPDKHNNAMRNFKLPSFVRFLIGGFVILMLGGLAGWYFYLHSQGAAIDYC